MIEKPILFNGEMVRATLDGSKTQTRRVVKKVFIHEGHDCINDLDGMPSRLDFAPKNWDACPYGQIGDELWLRETIEKAKNYGGIGYPADGSWLPAIEWVWKRDKLPSIHMPRWASRIQLRITDTRVERLQDISEDDAIKEGVALTPVNGCEIYPPYAFQELWQSINGAESWDKNPWVWVISFVRIKP